MCASSFESSQALADGTCLAQNFVLKKVTLGLKFGTHFSPEGTHFGTKSGELCAEGGDFGLSSFNLRF